MLTLADYPQREVLLRRAAAIIGRSISDAAVEELLVGMARADADSEVVEAMSRCDCSAAEHEHAEMLHFRRSGLDEELARAWYSLLGRPGTHPIYAEVPALLHTLASHDVRVVVISDIHVDLRMHARAAGIEALVDGWVLSYEHGVQKPDLQIYELGLDVAGVDASDALMVGDRHVADGTASLLGVDSLILPARLERDPLVIDSRLDGVARLSL